MSNMKRRAVFGSTVAAVAAVPFVGAGEAHAASFEVTNLDDSGPGSLRDAILAANANPDADVITFQSGLTGTITVANVLRVTGPTSIAGPGADVITVAGDGNDGVFYLYGIAGMEVTISDLTISGGYREVGSNILAYDTDLTLDSVVVTDGVAQQAPEGVAATLRRRRCRRVAHPHAYAATICSRDWASVPEALTAWREKMVRRGSRA